LVLRVGEELAVDDVGDPSLEAAQRFLLRLRLGELAVVVGPSWAATVADLGDAMWMA